MEIQKHVYGFKNLSHHSSIIQGISTKHFGSMKDEKELQIDREALDNFAQEIGITEPIVCMKQIHSGTVAVIEDNNQLVIPETDALVTDQKNIPLAVLTADCLPIMLYDPKKEVIGIAHGGYKGLLHHIIEHTIHTFVSAFKSNPKDIIVGIGPSIERDCYEVGVELVEKFQETFPSYDDIFAEKDGKYVLDLRTIALQGLMKAGILKKHIEVMDSCTKCDSNFYSYRGGDGDKRFVSVISIKS